MAEKMPLTSEDIRTERIARLRENFPEVFTEGKVDFERLKQVLGEEVAEERERYGLSWAGKSEAVRNIQTPSVATLVPDRKESVEFDATENLFIEGDNLEVLKLLQKSYHGRVKMIYIRPSLQHWQRVHLPRQLSRRHRRLPALL
jgi:adenine-specific DNA-methyltransferase